MRYLCILFLFCAVTCYSQTFYSPVICKLTLRVDEGVRFWGIPGTGSMVTIDADGYLSRGYAGAATVTGLVPTEVLFGKSDGTIDQDPEYYYDDVNNYLTIGDPTDVTGLTPATILVANGVDNSSISADNVYVSNASLGVMYIDGGLLNYTDLGGDIFSIGRVPWSTDMNLLFPAAKGTANQILKVGSVAGDDVNLVWAADALGSVTSFSFTDAHGFDGTVTNATTTPALELITTVTDNQIMYSTGGDITGSPLFTWDDATNAERLDVTLFDFLVRGTSTYGVLGLIDDGGTVQFGDLSGSLNSTKFTLDDGGEIITLKADNGITLDNFTGTGDNLLYSDNAAGKITPVTLTANDFDFSAPTLSIDYANGQEATTSQDGFLSQTDWDTFNEKGFTIVISGSQNTIADATSYYSGATQNNSSGIAGANRIYIPRNCTLVAGYGFFLNAGTAGTGESGTFYVRKNNTTDATVSASVTTNATHNTFNGTGLTATYVAGDYIEGKWLTPTYATNPSNCRWTVTLYFIPN